MPATPHAKNQTGAFPFFLILNEKFEWKKSVVPDLAALTGTQVSAIIIKKYIKMNIFKIYKFKSIKNINEV